MGQRKRKVKTLNQIDRVTKRKKGVPTMQRPLGPFVQVQQDTGGWVSMQARTMQKKLMVVVQTYKKDITRASGKKKSEVGCAVPPHAENRFKGKSFFQMQGPEKKKKYREMVPYEEKAWKLKKKKKMNARKEEKRHWVRVRILCKTKRRGKRLCDRATDQKHAVKTQSKLGSLTPTIMATKRKNIP